MFKRQNWECLQWCLNGKTRNALNVLCRCSPSGRACRLSSVSDTCTTSTGMPLQQLLVKCNAIHGTQSKTHQTPALSAVHYIHWNANTTGTAATYLLQTLGKGVTCISDHNSPRVTSLLRRPPFIEGPSSLFCNALWCPGHRIHCRCRSCDTGQDSCAIYMKCHPTHSKQGIPHTFTLQCIAHCEDPVDPDIWIVSVMCSFTQLWSF